MERSLPVCALLLPKPPHSSLRPAHGQLDAVSISQGRLKGLSQRYQPSKAAARLPQKSEFQLHRPFLELLLLRGLSLSPSGRPSDR